MQVSSNSRIATTHTPPAAAWSAAAVRSFFIQPVNLVFLTVVVIIAFLGLYPSIYLLYGSLTDAPLGVPGHFTLSNYIHAYGNLETYHLVLTSFVFAAGASALSVFLSLVLAWITIRTNAPCRKVFELIAIIPNIMPTLLIAISWVLLLNPNNGLINVVLTRWLGLPQAPFNIYSLPGLIFVEGLILTPLAFLIIAAALKSMDPALEESAKTLGSNDFGVAMRITLPLMRPAILAAVTLNFVRAIESFDAPAIIAIPARIDVFTTAIYREALGSFPTNQNLAAAYGIGILVIALICVYIYRSLTSRVESFSTVTGGGFHPHQIDLGRWKYVASEEASIASGAGFFSTFRRIMVPLVRPGMIAGWIILATIFIREFSISIFLYSPGSEPLGPLLYFYYLDGSYGRMAAVGLMISLISIILIALAQRFSHWEME